jgi:adenylate kinase family enzyme
MSITIISGAPGSGKTSLARLLSASEPRGVHIKSDMFFHFLAHRVDPSLPAADSQNATVVRAYLAVAIEYSAGGYGVYLDGVIGPWLLPLIASMASDIEYVLLHAPLNVVLTRARARTSQPSATPDVVIRMHEPFSNIPEAFRKRVIQTNDKSIEQVANEYRASSKAGAMRSGTPSECFEPTHAKPRGAQTGRWSA